MIDCRLLEQLSTVCPNTAAGGLDSVAVALLMAALQALHFSPADNDDVDLPIISGTATNNMPAGTVPVPYYLPLLWIGGALPTD